MKGVEGRVGWRLGMRGRLVQSKEGNRQRVQVRREEKTALGFCDV
jgi:hypothetical protein